MKPLAVISGDIHYSIKNLELADKVTRMAISKANGLNIPLISNGDLSDTKAILRAECVNALIETFKLAKVKPIVNVGNHSRINEKSSEHSLHFLKPYANVIDTPQYILNSKAYMCPYDHDKNQLKGHLSTLPDKTLLILHQGLSGSDMGDYVIDHSALEPKDLSRFRTILSHYHGRQDIQCGNNIASYIGSPYTQSWAEAGDKEKGFQILMDDGSLEFVPTNLRKHIVYNFTDYDFLGDKYTWYTHSAEDLVWLKITGNKEDLIKINKSIASKILDIDNFRLDLIPIDIEAQTPANKNELSQAELLDSLIDSLTNTSDYVKSRLKSKWKDLK